MGNPSDPQPEPETMSMTKVLPFDTPKLRDLYSVGKVIGEGQFGTVYLCTDKSDGKEYACKSIDKRKLVRKQHYEDVLREFHIMKHLQQHPNVVEFREAFEDEQSVDLVMELCGGGDMYERINDKGRYGEKEAARLIKSVVGAVKFCHLREVMHRDLKLENLLFVSNGEEEEEDAVVKVTDFGLSVFFKPGETFKASVGSPFYVAPEVLLENYGPEADVWSAGVILYILLSGVPPFWAETVGGILDEVVEGHLDFKCEPWPCISEGAKDLILNMLNRDPKKRSTAQQVLDHPWVVNAGVTPHKPSVSYGSSLISVDDLSQAFGDCGIDEVHLDEQKKEFGPNNDGRLDSRDFVAMVRKRTRGKCEDTEIQPNPK